MIRNRSIATLARKSFRNGSVTLLPLLLFLFSFFLTKSQSEIPIGSWRIHISYNNIHSITLSEQKVFAASENGIVVLEKAVNSIITYSKIDGLSGQGITAMQYHPETDQLIVAYKNGKVDLIKANKISSFDLLRNSSLPGPKKINHISIRENLAYLASDFGVVIFDLTKKDTKETWRDIGANGQTLRIFKSAFKDDSIFLATDKGVLAGDLGTNLMDFNFWKRFDIGTFSDTIQSIEAFNGKIYAAVKNDGLFRYEAGKWSKESFLENEPLQSLNASTENLFISSDTTLWRLSIGNILSQILSAKLTSPNMAVEEPNGDLWIADHQNGMVSGRSGNFIPYLPNGPSNWRSTKLRYHDGIIYSLGGGYTSSLTPLGIPGNIDEFGQGLWSTQSSSMTDLTDISFIENSDQKFVSSFGFGLEERNELGVIQIYDESNSPLVNTSATSKSVYISSLQQVPDGLWAANYGASQPLHFLSANGTWSAYAFAPSSSRYPLLMAVDFYNNIWIVPNPNQGGGLMVFDKEKNKSRFLTNVNGAGGLPSMAVRSIAMDRDGSIWLGTDEGVCYFSDPSTVFAPEVNAIKPIFESRFLLRDDKITAIATDGGNRKWIGTERGVWLFNPSGEELIYNFTMENSPLLSNVILDIEVNNQTGEVFFATDQGLVSFRGDATESDFQFKNVKIFPNPVTPGFNGKVGMSGLATDAVVKITDIAGKLVWESNANGGTASWDVKDYRGRRVSTGVYLVFCVTADGSENVVGKIAVVE